MSHELNTQQRDAVETVDTPLMVLAGAGSGKTRVITTKILYLIKNGFVKASKIAAITFTNKAAREMQERLKQMLGDDKELPLVCTFHALGLRIIRIEYKRLGFKKKVSIFDVSDTQRLMRDILPKNTQKEDIEHALRKISSIKNSGITVEQSVHMTDEIPSLVSELYYKYQERLKQLSAVDFDDLILLPLHLFRQYEDVRLAWSERIRYLMVDEYQDTNASQYELVKYLAGSRGALTVVGDDDQSIYGWRGAKIENLENLSRDFEGLKVVKLEQNYRSRGNILNAANAVVANNPHNIDKKLWSALGDGPPVLITTKENPVKEAGSICSKIMTIRFQENCDYSECAILYRSNHLSRDIERSLREQRIPYHMSGGMSYFDRSEIKDVLSYCRVLINPDDDISLMRIINVPRREIGSTSIAQLREIATHYHCSLWEVMQKEDGLSRLRTTAKRNILQFVAWMQNIQDNMEDQHPVALVSTLVNESGYLRWLKADEKDPEKSRKKAKNIEEFIGWIERIASENVNADLAEVLSILALGSSDDGEDPGDVVRLMTIHASKGLEFEYVFVVGVEEGILPHQNSLDEGSDEEERRLMYVAMTRAREVLHLSNVKQRRKFGEIIKCKPSRFIDEIPSEYVVMQGAKDKPKTKETAKAHLEQMLKMMQD